MTTRSGTPSITAELRGVSADGVLTTTTTIPLRLNVVDDDPALTAFASAEIFEPDVAALFPAPFHRRSRAERELRFQD